MYYILVKRKNSSKWIGAIPSRKGVSKKDLSIKARRMLRKAYTYRIVTKTELKLYMKTRLASL